VILATRENGERNRVSDKSIIIIGAGLAGLSTGCYAQMNGYRSHIFEHHAVPGGVAATWKRKGYAIDRGIHFIMGHKPGAALHELYRELSITEANRFVDMTTYARFSDEASGRTVDVTQDLDRLAHDLKAFSPDDARVINELIAGARATQGLDMSEIGMSKPPEMVGRMERLKQIWNMRRVFKYMSTMYGQSVADYVQAIHDPWLRRLIENLFLPEVPVWFLFMLLGLLADGQLGLLEGGCLGLVQAIEKRYKNLGGRVTYNATVDKILVKNDRAVGVHLASGSKHHADFVVSAADGYSTIFKMLGGRYVDDEIEDRYTNWMLTRPTMMVSFGVNREFTGEPWLTVINLRHPFRAGNQHIDTIIIRIFNYSSRFAPEGKTVIQASFDTEWDWWNDLQKDRPRYEAEKERVAEQVLKQLEVYYTGISSLVEVVDVATPYTTWRYTLNHNGAYMGWLPTPEVLSTAVARTPPGLDNFYMAGQWVMPGGGVPPCLSSGRHVVQLLCHHDGKTFSTTTP